MSSKLILALDLGTTGVRAILYTPQGSVAGTAYTSFRQYYPKPGWVEHDAVEIYTCILRMIGQAQKKAGCNSSQISGIGITNQRETIVVWDKQTGRPFYRAIVWQDRRTEAVCKRLKLQLRESLVRAKTGLVLDPYFSAAKIDWILKNVPGVKFALRKNRVLAGTIDSWLLWKLTGVHATDYTNASRTSLFNIHKKQWDKQLLKVFQVPESILPRVMPSGALFGVTHGIKCLADGIPVHAILGDQQAALYGQGCVKQGDVKNTYGTGCFMVMNAGSKKPKLTNGLLTTLAAGSGGHPVYAFEGAVFIAGAVIQWLRDELKIIKTAEETEALANSVSDTHGMVMIPAFVGLGSPYWRADIRGSVSGLTRGVSRAHFVRAALESIAQQSADVLVSMRKASGLPIREMRTDGKACHNRFLMQFQADITGLTINASEQAELTAWGVARLAGERLGFWKRKGSFLKYRKYVSKLSLSQRKKIREDWISAVHFALSKN